MRVRKVNSVVVLMVLILLDLPSQIASQIGIHLKRAKLMKDAISVTFRRKGEPIDADTIEKVVYPKLSSHYATSRAFRAFVIAFEQGVSPRLTLGYDAPCDQKYTKEFKNPENGMVDWYSMKKFVFGNYKNRPSIQYCDYRQGLVCLSSGKCGCNTGATFSPVSSSASSSEKRCLLDVGQVCAIPDLDQGTGAGGYENDQLSQLVFNLEKPESCKPGTECRNIGSLLAKCHDQKTIPYDKLSLPSGENLVYLIEIGEECPLGLIQYQVRCMRTDDRNDDYKVGSAPGFSCYNFAPVGTFSRTGFCAHDLGSYQIYELGFSMGDGRTDAVLWRRNFVMGFVNRQTVPLFDRGTLKAYYKKYLTDVYKILFPSHEHEKWMLKLRSGDSCNEAKTTEMASIWKFYAGLVANPPTTTVTSLTDMNDKLKEISDMVNRNKGAICKVYWSYHYADYKEEQHPNNNSPTLLPPLKCDKNPSATGDDNDGLCVVDPNGDYTKDFAEKVQRLSDHAVKAVYGKKEEESNQEYLQILKDNPEPECKPLGKETRSLTRAVWPSEDLSCFSGSICMPNYEDPNVFDADCNLKPGNHRKVCLDVNAKYSECEGKTLGKDIMKELETIMVDKDALLGEWAECDHKLEEEVRAGVEKGEWTGNKRQLLVNLMQGRVRGVLCDRSRLLECNTENVCACLSGTDQREVVIMAADAEYHYKSDYCYLTSGTCSVNGLQDFVTNLTLFQKEIELIKNHYGSGEVNCTKGNHCMFVDQENRQCTMRDTLKTGHDLKPEGGDGYGGDGNGAGGGVGNGGGSGGGGRPGGSNPPGNGSPERKSSAGCLLTVILWLVW